MLLRANSVVNLVAWWIVARRTARQHTPLERGLRNVLRWQIALSLVAQRVLVLGTGVRESGSVVEESLWSLAALLALLVLLGLRAPSQGSQRRLHSVVAMPTAAYLAFWCWSTFRCTSSAGAPSRRAEIPWMMLDCSVGL